MRFLIMVAVVTFFLAWVREECRGNFLREFMEGRNLKGAVVIESLKTKKTYVYNDRRSKEPFLPASTFKIVNTLIALQEKALKDENEIIAWDGKDRGYPDWNKDHNLKTAFPSSCVWFYQTLARKIGNGVYLSYLREMGYGNMKTGGCVDSFWLDGDVRISARGQIDVLKNIHGRKYPFDSRGYEVLEALMVVDKKDGYIVRAKTGTVAGATPNIGWYVGYVETKDDVWFFAGNLDMMKKEHAGARKEMVYAALRELEIIR